MSPCRRNEIEAEWRVKALAIGGIVLVLCGLTIALSLLFGRELRRREAMQAELGQAVADGCPDRSAEPPRVRGRRYPGLEAARRSGKPLSLLIVDADHFKRFNDRYGHQVGDEVLQGLARCLSASVHRPHDLVCRIGGEEFAVLLRTRIRRARCRIAEKVHAEVSTLAIGSAGIGAGAVTVSIGLAAAVPKRGGDAALTDLYRLADGALYEAKAGGRNQTRCAKPHEPAVAPLKQVLRLMR